jgi:YHS domain-containing protein
MLRMLLNVMFFITLQMSVNSALAMQHINLDSQGKALHGYDPVSYFMGKPEKGDGAISYEGKDGKYLFVSEKNREVFVANPDKYRFAYGGYCAWAMLEGEKVDVDPERYKEIDGVIYLFYNTFFTDTLDKWDALAEKESEQKLVERADRWWQKLTNM